MKTLIAFIVILPYFYALSQPVSLREWKESVGIISEMLIVEGMLAVDSNGVWYSNMKTPLEIEAMYLKYTNQYVEKNKQNWVDVSYGSGYSFMSGVGLGLLESSAFGYKYPDMDSDNWLKRWLTMNTAGDQFFKLHHPNKVGRELNDVFDRLAYNDLEKFYGEWYWAYLHHFLVKNTTATIWRGWAKYGKPFYYFSVEFDVDWLLYRMFGLGE